MNDKELWLRAFVAAIGGTCANPADHTLGVKSVVQYAAKVAEEAVLTAHGEGKIGRIVE